jgi:hypothetical protein
MVMLVGQCLHLQQDMWQYLGQRSRPVDDGVTYLMV